ncbi:MAG: hypothetical protein KAR06_08640 [Deltaproteobacteria bacterium]|nr:hypothetical protein [Deltaproteobacteria bacterium]
MTPIVGDLLKNTVGKVVDKLLIKYLPSDLDEKEKTELKIYAQELALDELKTTVGDVQNARILAQTDSQSTAAWTKVLSAVHRPAWSVATLMLFLWSAIAPQVGMEGIKLNTVHQEIIQTVIIFYFGGRSVEKAISTVSANKSHF